MAYFESSNPPEGGKREMTQHCTISSLPIGPSFLTCLREQKSIHPTFSRNSNKLFSSLPCFNQHHRDVAQLSFSILPLISTQRKKKKSKKAEDNKKKHEKVKKEDFSYLDNRIIILRKKHTRRGREEEQKNSMENMKYK
jgi:hypothetical protein